MARRPPIVICQACKKAMIPSTSKPVSASGLQEVTYTCVFCRATTVYSIKPDEE